MLNSGPTLFLPKRFERLRDVAEQSDADLTRIVRKVPDATARIERLLKAVRDGGLGRFELFLGKSGSGKTTFLSTLPRFYQPARVTPVSDKVPLTALANFIRQEHDPAAENHIFVMLERDNPILTADGERALFEDLRRLFREKDGRVLVIWPITDEVAATRLAKTAWTVGRDSIVDLTTKGLFEFHGLPKDEYYNVADVTARSLNAGQSLEAFGLSPNVAAPLVRKADTISEFFGHLEEKSQEINAEFDRVLKERTIPSVWVLLMGDETKELNLTVATLTQGTQKHIDIDRFVAVLDDPDSDAAYLKEWKARRNEIAYILRRLDVRLFEVPPNVALAAARAFGDAAVKTKLKRNAGTKGEAVKSLQSARFFQALSGQPSTNVSKLRAASNEAADEYRRIQSLAGSNDKALNKALAAALLEGLTAAGLAVTVAAEKRAIEPGSNLQPDIRVEFPDGRIVCLEPTWRTTGQAIPGELAQKQNTMTVGHIQQYLLAKLLEYVKDLNL
jgi:energy-coupling factor transporter ATP-binding protein EcfA2